MDKYIDEYDYDEESIKLRHFLEQHASIAHMGEIVISSSDKPIIGTKALDTCYGIVLYDRLNKKGIVGHAVPSDRISIMHRMLKLLGADSKVIEYAIVSGYRTAERKDYDGEAELFEYLKNNCPPNVTLIPFKGLNVQTNYDILSYEFAFEVNTGASVANYLFYDGKKASKGYR